MRKRILLLVAAQTLTLGIPMATRAYADQNQVARAQPAAAQGVPTVEPTVPWPLRGLLPA